MQLPSLTLARFLAALLLTTPAVAADYFVRADHAAGANTGADWNNAWNGFDAIVWGVGVGRVGPGDTLWIAGGTYATPLGIGASGTPDARLTIQRARASDAIARATPGWTDALDAQVVITSVYGIYFDYNVGSYVTLDGRTPAGIRVQYGDAGTGVELDAAVDLHDIVLRYIETAGPGPIVQSGDTRGFDLTITGILRNLTISHCESHHSDTLLQISASENLVIEHSSFHHSGALNPERFHPNAVYLATVRDATIRYNRFHDHSVEGLFFGDPGNVGAKIYGNLFYQGASPPDTGRGIEFDDGADSRDFLVYNNTFVDLPLPGVNFANGQPHPGAIVQNNLFSGCSARFGPAAHDYNYFLPGGADEPHGVNGGASPFVNAAAFDYRIAGWLAADRPRNRGVALGAEFQFDAEGATRGADGAWDIGAFEFINSLPTITGPGSVTTLSGRTAGSLSLTVGDPETPADPLR